MNTEAGNPDPSEAFGASLALAMGIAAARIKPKTIYDLVAKDPKIIVKSNNGVDNPLVAHDDSLLLVGPKYACEEYPQCYWVVHAIELLRGNGYTGYIYLAYDLHPDIGDYSSTSLRHWNFLASRAAKKVMFWHPRAFRPDGDSGYVNTHDLAELCVDCLKVGCLGHLTRKLFFGSDSGKVIATETFQFVIAYAEHIAGTKRPPSTKLEDLVKLVLES